MRERILVALLLAVFASNACSGSNPNSIVGPSPGGPVVNPNPELTGPMSGTHPVVVKTSNGDFVWWVQDLNPPAGTQVNEGGIVKYQFGCRGPSHVTQVSTMMLFVDENGVEYGSRLAGGSSASGGFCTGSAGWRGNNIPQVPDGVKLNIRISLWLGVVSSQPDRPSDGRLDVPSNYFVP